MVRGKPDKGRIASALMFADRFARATLASTGACPRLSGTPRLCHMHPEVARSFHEAVTALPQTARSSANRKLQTYDSTRETYVSNRGVRGRATQS